MHTTSTGGAPATQMPGVGGAHDAGPRPGCTQPPCDATAGDHDALPTTMLGDADANHDAGSLAMPDPQYLVPATGPCPEFANGYATFHPDGVERSVLLYMSDAAMTLDGPLIFSWHSTLPGPETSNVWIGDAVIPEIEAQGGIIAAPSTVDPNATRPWDHTPLGPSGDNDERLMDEVVACANEKVGIDLRRIHSIGMSAGGQKTSQVSLRRSGYIASVVVYSGGLPPDDHPPDQNPDNKFSAMILYGGPTDISPVDATNYTDASNAYLHELQAKGRFGFLCNHGGGHSVPSDSQDSAWRFLQDHPYGAWPSPYAKGLPNGFLSYCSLQ
jgi:predicted esterase